MFQPSFSFPSWQKAIKSSRPNDFSISAERFFVLRQAIFLSQPNEMKHG